MNENNNNKKLKQRNKDFKNGTKLEHRKYFMFKRKINLIIATLNFPTCIFFRYMFINYFSKK